MSERRDEDALRVDRAEPMAAHVFEQRALVEQDDRPLAHLTVVLDAYGAPLLVRLQAALEEEHVAALAALEEGHRSASGRRLVHWGRRLDALQLLRVVAVRQSRQEFGQILEDGGRNL